MMGKPWPAFLTPVLWTHLSCFELENQQIKLNASLLYYDDIVRRMGLICTPGPWDEGNIPLRLCDSARMNVKSLPTGEESTRVGFSALS